jgi:hypothetical protein
MSKVTVEALADRVEVVPTAKSGVVLPAFAGSPKAPEKSARDHPVTV